MHIACGPACTVALERLHTVVRYLACSFVMQSTCYKSVEVAAEEASDPGLIILYDAAAIHMVLAQPYPTGSKH